MKTIVPFVIIATFLCSVTTFEAKSQCPNGVPPQTIVYDSVAYGNGNSSRTFSFPRFNPALGTLISVNVQSFVRLEYSYSLENQTNNDAFFRTRIVRTDDVTSTALQPSSINAVNQTPPYTSYIQSHDVLEYGPAKMNYTIGNLISDGRVANFMGTGSVQFDYETGTSASVQGPLPWQLNFTSVNDTTHMRITYNYCPNASLAAGLYFNANAQTNGKIILYWQQPNELLNRLYNIEMSTDGRTFKSVGSMKSAANGSYTYPYIAQTKTKHYFRIKQTHQDGRIDYSSVRSVEPEMDAVPLIKVSPTFNVDDNFRMEFNKKSDWQVTLYTYTGQPMYKTKFSDASAATVYLLREHTTGIYIVEAVNLKTGEKATTRILMK